MSINITPATGSPDTEPDDLTFVEYLRGDEGRELLADLAFDVDSIHNELPSRDGLVDSLVDYGKRPFNMVNRIHDLVGHAESLAASLQQLQAGYLKHVKVTETMQKAADTYRHTKSPIAARRVIEGLLLVAGWDRKLPQELAESLGAMGMPRNHWGRRVNTFARAYNSQLTGWIDKLLEDVSGMTAVKAAAGILQDSMRDPNLALALDGLLSMHGLKRDQNGEVIKDDEVRSDKRN